MFSNRANDFAGSVDAVMFMIVICSVILLLGVTAAMIYFVIRYNKKRNPVASQISHNTTLEILWIVVPTVLVLFMFYFGYIVFEESRVVPKGALKVKVIARMWSWQFEYENGKKSDTLYIPANKPIKLDLITVDVNHSCFIPALRIKEDAMAGRTNYMVLSPVKTGQYDIVCAEYCGLNHSLMYGVLKVIPQDKFYKWLGANAPVDPDSTNETEDDEIGRTKATSENLRYLQSNGCFSCHSLDGTNDRGPSFAELSKGKTTIIDEDGERIIEIDDAYLKRSILEPKADIVKGFEKFPMAVKFNNKNSGEIDSLVKELNIIRNNTEL